MSAVAARCAFQRPWLGGGSRRVLASVRGTSACPRARAYTTMTAKRPLESGVEPSRVRSLNGVKLQDAASATGDSKADRPFVLYWMVNSVRTRHSPALEYAAGLAARMRVELRCAHVFDVLAQDGEALPERHAAFLLEALADAQRTLREERNITLAVVRPGKSLPDAVARLAERAVAVVTDTSYLRKGIKDRLAVAKALKRHRVPCYAVEGDIVVPVEVATDKLEHAARTIRPKIKAAMDEFLTELPPVSLDPDIQPVLDPARLSSHGTRHWVESCTLETLDVRNVDAALASIDGLDRGAPRVPEQLFRGGETDAQARLATFLKSRLSGYAEGRNEPALKLQSDLSPYLRIGAISPVEITLRTHEHASGKTTKGVKDGVDGFLEELIIRRELGANMCWFDREHYDDYDHTVPEFARDSLELHRQDKRQHIYSYEELEAGVTHDAYWNAAQHEMLVTGKMHGYMRMYWAKQVIGWTPDAQTALKYCMRLNNRWELDAVDPNSYAGVIWNFGRHDQGWKERPVWGKVRYMNDAGLKRKFNMAAYIAKVDQLVKQHGLPPHIGDLVARSKKRKGAQLTMDQMGTHGVKGRAALPKKRRT